MFVKKRAYFVLKMFPPNTQGSSEAAAVASRLAIAERVASERKDDASSAKESARTLSESVRHLTSIRDNLHQQMEDLKKDKEQVCRFPLLPLLNATFSGNTPPKMFGFSSMVDRFQIKKSGLLTVDT